MGEDRPLCVECAAPSHHDHHVIPRSMGGTFTVPLCETCHGTVHGIPFGGHRRATLEGLAKRRAAGKSIGRFPPYGYTKGRDGVLIVQPEEQATIARARELRAAGLSLRKIAAALLGEGYANRRGAKFNPNAILNFEAMQISRMLRSRDGGAEKTGADD